jgi:hypothetical protein
VLEGPGCFLLLPAWPALLLLLMLLWFFFTAGGAVATKSSTASCAADGPATHAYVLLPRTAAGAPKPLYLLLTRR